jgi:hypothetical protein
MGKGNRTALRQDAAPARQVIPTALKWVGGITAVLSLLFGLHQLSDLVSAHRQREREVKELLNTSKMQERSGDYSAAWNSLDQADRLTKGAREVRAAQESVAMEWLENAHVNPDQQKFADITGKVVPVLDRAVSTAEGSRKADLLAHLGWAEFLRSRDGVSGVQPDDFYRRALTIDPHNPYAHAMLGHWILWNGGTLADAREEFSQALAAGRAHDLARQLQLSALQNTRTDDAEAELLRTMNDMRKANEHIDSHTRARVWAIYYFGFGFTPSEGQHVLDALPAEEQLATYKWLFDRPDFDSSKIWGREYYRAILQEAAGQRAEALQTLLRVRANLPRDYSPYVRKDVGRRIADLSKRA